MPIFLVIKDDTVQMHHIVGILKLMNTLNISITYLINLIRIPIVTVSADGRSPWPARLGVHPIWWR